METTINFNLRSQRGSTSAIIVVIYEKGKQTRFTLGESVIIKCWNKKRQECDISSVFSNEVNRKNIEINKKIRELRNRFQDFCLSLPLDIEALKINNMGRLRKIYTASALLNTSLRLNKNIKESTYLNKKNGIAKFLEYLKEKNLKDNYTVFTENIIIQYHNWLLTQMSAKASNNYASNINSLLKDIVLNEDYLHLNIPIPKPYKPAKDNRTKEDKKHFEVFKEEYEAIRDYKGEPEEERVGKTFYLLCMTGVRYSDIKTVIDSADVEGIKTITTTKENTKAQIIYTSEMAKICNELKGYDYSYNKFIWSLHKIAKNLHLDREITYVDSSSKIVKKPFYEALTPHCARITKATQLLREGISKEVIADILGWSSTKMIDQVYGKLTTKDKENRVAEALNVKIEKPADNELEKYKLEILRKSKNAYKEWNDPLHN